MDLSLLNQQYQPLHHRSAALLRILRANGFAAESGWYNGHYHRDKNGAYQPDFYPIPVLTLAGLCDIELDFRSTSFTAKRTRSDVLSDDFIMPDAPDFEAYGEADYLLDFRLPGMSLAQMRESILRSREQNICFQFTLPADASPDAVLSLVRQLRAQGFFY